MSSDGRPVDPTMVTPCSTQRSHGTNRCSLGLEIGIFPHIFHNYVKFHIDGFLESPKKIEVGKVPQKQWAAMCDSDKTMTGLAWKVDETDPGE